MLKTIIELQSSYFMNLPRKVSFSFRSLVSREPALWLLYQPYLWWGQMKRINSNATLDEGLLFPDTELVIDGFQGSANSFATAAFKIFQTQPVRLMHHRHAPVLIIQAVQHGIPVLLTIREPEGTVISLTSRWPHVSVTQALKSYIRFYSKLEPYSSHFVISTFEQTTQHLDQVINNLNVKFGTHFDWVDVDLANSEYRKQVSDTPKSVVKRKMWKEKKREELSYKRNTQLLTQAMQIYEKYNKFSIPS